MPKAARESLARCTHCGWAGIQAVRVVVGAFAARGPRPNPCPGCADGEVRCALNLDEEREAIRQHLTVAFPEVQAWHTDEGKLAVVVGMGRGVPRVATLDPRALDGDPRSGLDRLALQLQPDAAISPPRTPYR